MSNTDPSSPASSQPTPAGAGRTTAKSPATGRIAVVAALLGAVVFVCVNIVSAKLFGNARVDLTQQHLYSLSQGTRTLLGELKEPVRFRLFMSSGLTKQAPQLAAFAARVRSLPRTLPGICPAPPRLRPRPARQAGGSAARRYRPCRQPDDAHPRAAGA